MQVSELKGLKSLRALNAFHALMLGVKMLPMYLKESYEEFFDRVQAMPAEDQAKVIREAALFVNLEKEEVEAMAYFCKDANGAPFLPESLAKMPPDKLVDIIVAVGMEIAKIKIDLVTEAEKKN